MKILCIGDSLLTKVELYENLEFSYVVACYPGELARDFGDTLKKALDKDKFDLVILCLGTNDLAHGLAADTVVQSLTKMHEMIRETGAKVGAVYLWGFPLFNEIYSDASKDDVSFCAFCYELEDGDLQKDEVHLTEQGIEHFNDFLQDFVETETLDENCKSC